jgi:predicted Zn-dependent peptidase
LEEVVTVIQDVLSEVSAHGLTPAEVARAQGNLRGGLVLGLEDTPSRMNRIGRSELDYGHQRTVTDSLERIAAVTPGDVAGLAGELLTQPFTAAVVGPFDDEAALPGVLR